MLDDTKVSEKDLKAAKAKDSTLDEQIKMAGLIAEGLGVNVQLFNSFDKATWHGTENGSYNPATNTIMLDINAGKASANDFKSGLLAVCGHELTHWMETYAYEAYSKYKDAVVKYIGKAKLEELILEQQSRDPSLTRDEAIDEIVADASMDRMADKEFWQVVSDNLGEDRAEVKGKIAQYVSKFLGAIRKALGTKQTFYARDVVAQMEKDLQSALSALYAEGVREAAATYKGLTGTVSQEAAQIGASDQMVEDAMTQHSSKISQETLDFLDNQEHVTVYRAMQLIDGELYPHMAAKVKDENGKLTLVEPTKIGQWYQAVERPDLIDPKTGKWRLNKGNGTAIDAAYNPYFHSSASPLNDQFSSAYKRDNLVVVEGKIPSSELTSGYKAQYAKDSVGETKWHSGPVASQLKGDKARRVFLSRWFQAVRVMSDAEVASIVAKTLEGEDVAVPSNVVTPGLLKALRAEGVKIEEKNTARKDGVKKSTKEYRETAQEEITKSYQDAVHKILNGDTSINSAVLMGYTPSIFTKLGMPSLPFTIEPGHIYAIAKTKAEAIAEDKYGKDAHYHGMGEEAVKELYEKLQDPVIVIQNLKDPKNTSPMRSTHSIVAIIDVGQGGKPVYMPVAVTAGRNMNGLRYEVNELSTAFPMKEKDVKKIVTEAVARFNAGEPSIFYTKEEAANLVSAGVAYPKLLEQIAASNGIVQPITAKVNLGVSDVTESLQFLRWFGNWKSKPETASKVVDNNGAPKIMYRGDENPINVFDRQKAKSGLYGRGFYFTDSKSHAGQYGKARPYYLNVRNPMQANQHKITRGQMRKFLEAVAKNEDYDFTYYGQSATVASVLKDIFGKGDFEMLQDVSATAIGDLVEAVELFNKVNGTHYDGIIAPTETVVFDSRQIKSATDNIGTFDRNNPDVRFSMKAPVEQTDRLIAWHNMNEDALRSALELGGLAMPSWAIKTADKAHTSYGSISVIAPRSLVDPKMNRNSMIFGGDAWTPVFPGVDYKISYDAVNRLSDEIEKLIGADALRDLGGAALDETNIADQFEKNGGRVSQYYKRNQALRYAYLKSIGEDINLPMTQKRLDQFGKYNNAEVENFASRLVNGSQSLQYYRNMSGREIMQQQHQSGDGSVIDFVNHRTVP